MKQLAAIGIFLLALVCVAQMAHAQSGRRSGQMTGGPASTPGTKSSAGSAADSSAEGDVVDEGVVAHGETVEGDVLRVNTSLVTVPVSVMDRNGRYIPNLGRGDFHIYEDGVEQRIR